MSQEQHDFLAYQSPMGSASRASGASDAPSATGSTAGEEVMLALYQKACKDRDQYAQTNAQYAKLLETCAEQNGVAERTAIAAKEEASQAVKAMQASCAERDTAVQNMQRTEANLASQLQEQSNMHAKEIKELTTKLDKLQHQIHTTEQSAAARVNNLADENAQLRSAHLRRTTEAVTLPRQIALERNDAKREMLQELSRVSQQVLDNQKAADRMATQYRAEIARITQEREALAVDLTAVRGQLHQSKKDAATNDVKAQEQLEALRQELAAAQEECCNLTEQAQQAIVERDGVFQDAENSLLAKQTEFDAQMKAMQEKHAANEERLLRSLHDITQQYEKEKRDNQAEKARLWQRAEDASNTLKTVKTQLLAAKKECAAALRTKNAAVRDATAALTVELQNTKDTLAARVKEVAMNQTQWEKEATAHAAELASRDAIELPTMEIVGAKEEDVVALRQQLILLEQRVHEKEKEALDGMRQATHDAGAAKLQVAELTDRLIRQEAAAAEEVAALNESHQREMHRVSQMAEKEGRRSAKQIKDLERVIEVNAEQVNESKELKGALRATEAKVAALREELRNVASSQQENEGGLSAKRKRKY